MTQVRFWFALLTLLAAPAAVAQQYPSKPVRLVTPFAPGGPVDITARILAQKLGETFNQQFIVDSRPGATGMIGAEHVAKSAPDGYTILVTASAHVIVPHMFSKMTYDPLRDFTPVTVVLTSPLLLTVTPSLPAKTVKFVESGYKELVTGSWYAVWVPAKTPEPIVARLNTELVRIVNLPDVRNRIIELGGVPVGNSVAEFDAFQKAESARWAKIIRESAAKLE